MRFQGRFLGLSVLAFTFVGIASAQDLLVGETSFSASTGTVMQVSSTGNFSPYATFAGAQGVNGLVADPSGNLYTVNSSFGAGTSILKLTPGGTTSTVATASGANSDPPEGDFLGGDLAIGPGGTLYNQGYIQVDSFANSSVFKITPSGQFTTLTSDFYYGTGFSNVVVGTNGNIFCASAYSQTGSVPSFVIHEIAPSGVMTTFSQNYAPLLVTDGAGNLYGIVGSDVYKYASNGSETLYATYTTGNAAATAATFGPNGDLYIADYNLHDIFQVTPSGHSSNYTPGGIPGSNDPTFSVTGLTFAPAAVPEPGAYAIFGFGLLGLGLRKKKRKARGIKPKQQISISRRQT